MNYRVAYPVGNTPRRDHVFWPTILRSQLITLVYGVDTPETQRAIELEYPVGVDLDTIMAIHWRVREWKIEASTFAASHGAYDGSPGSQDDIAQINYAGTTPEFSFQIQRYDPEPSLDVRNVTDEQDFLGEWRNKPLARDFRNVSPFDPIWKTCRNLGVSQGTSDGLIDFSNSAADPALIASTWNFTEPYNHAKFGEGGTGDGGVFVFYMLTGYTIYDPFLDLFYPRMFFSFGGAQLPFQGFGDTEPIFNLLPVDPIVTPDDPDILCGELTINLGATGVGPIVIPIGRFFVPPGGDPDVFIIPATTGDFDLVMNATKFWPFKTKGGDPVYDELTGEELADPFS